MEDEYTIGINKNTMCKLKLFKSIDELVYFGKSINRLAMTNIFLKLRSFSDKFTFLSKYKGAISEETILPIIRP